MKLFNFTTTKIVNVPDAQVNVYEVAVSLPHFFDTPFQTYCNSLVSQMEKALSPLDQVRDNSCFVLNITTSAEDIYSHDELLHLYTLCTNLLATILTDCSSNANENPRRFTSPDKLGLSQNAGLRLLNGTRYCNVFNVQMQCQGVLLEMIEQ